jgi:Replication protein
VRSGCEKKGSDAYSRPSLQPPSLDSRPALDTTAGVTPLVHPLETAQQSPPVHVLPITWAPHPRYPYAPPRASDTLQRHGFWLDRRRKVWTALNTSGASDNRLRNFHQCGSGLALYVSEKGDDLHLRASCCHDRFCDACQKARGWKIQHALRQWMPGRNTKFLTFTLKHSTTPLRDQLDRLQRSFAEMRRRKSWRDHIVGGACFFEVSVGRDRLWHVHLHCLVEGKFWPIHEISAEWHKVTGDSFIVDIQAKGSDDSKIRYCTKYVTKPGSDDVYADPARLAEFVPAMKGKRLCATFGTWRELALTDVDDEPDTHWVSAGSISSLAQRMQDGDPDAARLLVAAVRKWPTLASYVPALDAEFG